MASPKEATGSNTGNATASILPSYSQSGKYAVFLAGAGLTTASFLVSGGSLALLGSGVMCGAGLKLSLLSLQEILNTAKNEKDTSENAENQEKEKEDSNQNGWLQLWSDTGLGALNGLISSIGLVCIEQNQCNDSHQIDSLDPTQQLIVTYAAVGLVTGTINGTINQVMKAKENRLTSQNHATDDIELFNVGKAGFMEMGSNMITAIGKATLFKSATDDRVPPSYFNSPQYYVPYMQFNQAKRRIFNVYHDKIQHTFTTPDIMRVPHRNFTKILTVSPYRKQINMAPYF